MFPQKDPLTQETFYAEYLAALKPEGLIEKNFAEAVAASAWRLKTVRLAEEKLLSDAASPLEAFTGSGKHFQALTTYEQRMQRIMERNLSFLRKLQAKRQTERAKAFEEAKVLAQQNYSKHQPYDPTYDYPRERGITFTSAEINTSIQRDQRVREAKRNDKYAFDPAHRRDRYKLELIDLPFAEGSWREFEATLRWPPESPPDPCLLTAPSSAESP